mgnify:FL=1
MRWFMQQHYFLYLYTLSASFLLALGLTYLMRRLALRWDFLDHPGDRKIHHSPIPLLGGVAIVATFYIMVFGHMFLFAVMDQYGPAWIERNLSSHFGENSGLKLAGVLLGGLMIFVLGVVDDMKVLRPWTKLLGQIAAAAVLVLAGNRIEMFVLSNWWLSAFATIFWVVLIVNSMNFLDNMDGLCGGVSIIAAYSFFLCLQPHEDQLVRFLLIIFAGSVAGFLYFNLSPARIFMGDAGAMFNGYFLATVAVLGTFHVETTPSRIAIAAPLLALSVPLFDTISVVFLRVRSGQNIMLGDKRHFSHRLVDLGMSPHQAVAFIFLVAGVAGLGGALLPLMDLGGTLIILAQTAGLFLLIVLLMNAKRRNGGTES